MLYFKKLDTLRFLAFFLVFWQHAFSDFFRGFTFFNKVLIEKITNTGGIGVHVFFVLSGFLITFLLIKELTESGKVSLKNFYVRRVLRIWPLYYLIVILGIFILPGLIQSFHFCGNIYYNLFFLNNYDFGNSCTAKNVNITWSVAIEEQFYLVWPIIFIVLKKRLKLLFIFCFLVLVLGFIYKINADELNAYFHTFGNISYLMMGCLGAIFFSKYKETITSSKWMNPSNVYLAIGVIFLMVLFDSVFSLIFLPLIYMYVILNLVVNNKEVKESLISRLGKYTFGMYLYHPTIIIFTKIAFDILHLNYQNGGGVSFLVGVISFLVTIFISIVSYEFFEKKILRFKTYFSQTPTRV